MNKMDRYFDDATLKEIALEAVELNRGLWVCVSELMPFCEYGCDGEEERNIEEAIYNLGYDPADFTRSDRDILWGFYIDNLVPTIEEFLDEAEKWVITNYDAVEDEEEWEELLEDEISYLEKYFFDSDGAKKIGITRDIFYNWLEDFKKELVA